MTAVWFLLFVEDGGLMVDALLISGLNSLRLALTGYIALCMFLGKTLYSLYKWASMNLMMDW